MHLLQTRLVLPFPCLVDNLLVVLIHESTMTKNLRNSPSKFLSRYDKVSSFDRLVSGRTLL